MPEVFVSRIDDFAEGDRRIVFHGGLEIGVFHWQGSYYAYENLCLHQGGPCCEGVIMHKVEDVLAPDKTWIGQKTTPIVEAGMTVGTPSKPDEAAETPLAPNAETIIASAARRKAEAFLSRIQRRLVVVYSLKGGAIVKLWITCGH